MVDINKYEEREHYRGSKKYKKKNKVKKSDHKHLYEEVICIVKDKNKESKGLIMNGKECTICGKVQIGGIFTVRDDELSHFSRLVSSIEDVKELYPNMKVVETYW